MKIDQTGVFKLRKAENGVQYLYIPELDETGRIRTFFTSRLGGVSKGPFCSLNFGKFTDDAPENIEENRKRVFEALNIEHPIMVFPRQVHGDAIACIGVQDVTGRNNITIEETDAVITRLKHVILTTVHADCIPVYLADLKNGVIGLAHAGWRGTRENIAVKTADRMVELLGAEKSSMIAVIGPGVAACCFEVGQEVYDAFKEVFPYVDRYASQKENGKFLLDLKSINERQLRTAGIENVKVSGFCTCCDEELFFSHRRDHGMTGRMAAGISLI
jgi:polyphenol oxidase